MLCFGLPTVLSSMITASHTWQPTLRLKLIKIQFNHQFLRALAMLRALRQPHVARGYPAERCRCKTFPLLQKLPSDPAVPKAGCLLPYSSSSPFPDKRMLWWVSCYFFIVSYHLILWFPNHRHKSCCLQHYPSTLGGKISGRVVTVCHTSHF